MVTIRQELYQCMTARADALCELSDAVFCRVYGRGKNQAQMIPGGLFRRAHLRVGSGSWSWALRSNGEPVA